MLRFIRKSASHLGKYDLWESPVCNLADRGRRVVAAVIMYEEPELVPTSTVGSDSHAVSM